MVVNDEINKLDNQNKLIIDYAKSSFNLNEKEIISLTKLNSDLNKEINKTNKLNTNKWKIKTMTTMRHGEICV